MLCAYRRSRQKRRNGQRVSGGAPLLAALDAERKRWKVESDRRAVNPPHIGAV